MLRILGKDERLVVTRRARVRRVAQGPLALKLPVYERGRRIAMSPHELPIVVHATTRDGVPVVLFADATCRVTDAWRTPTAFPGDPIAEAAVEVERALSADLAALDLTDVDRYRPRAEEISRVTMLWGVEVERVDLHDVEARVSPALRKVLER